MRQPHITSNDGAFPYAYASEDRGIRIYSNIILQYRVSWYIQRLSLCVVLEVLGSEGHSLVEGYAFPDDSGRADNNARTVVDTELLPYLCGRVYIDAGDAMCLFGDEPRQDGYT